MNLDLFDKTLDCPVCKNQFVTKKLKTTKVKVAKLHTDFYTEYRSDNPNYYSIFVCPQCGYSAFENDFQKISDADKMKIRKTVTAQWKSRSYGDERSCSEAIETYKLAFLCYSSISHKMSVMAKIALRIMWLYRECGDEVNEKKFMKAAAAYFVKSYEMDHHTEENKSEEYQIMFMAGELNRQLGNLNDAVRWFGMLLREPDIKKARHIEIKARELMMEAADEYRKNGGVITEEIE